MIFIQENAFEFVVYKMSSAARSLVFNEITEYIRFQQKYISYFEVDIC